MFVFEIIDDVKSIIGNCEDETAFDRLTEAWRVLSNKGHFKNFIGYVDLCNCGRGTHFTLPVEVETPLAVNINGRPKIFRNTWSEFHFNGLGSNNNKTSWNWDDSGFYPVVMDILDHGEIIAVANSLNDRDKLIRVFGLDEKGKPLRTQDPDGTWLDGIPIPINLPSDFPFELVKPDPERYFVRYFETLPITKFTSPVAHDFETGAEVTLTLSVAPIPAPLVDATNYFVRLDDNDTVTLHPTREDSLADSNAIVIENADPASRIFLTDRRGFIVQTKMVTTNPHNLETGGIVGFTGSLPTPLEVDINYFANKIDDNNFTIHPTEDDAINGTDAINIQDTVPNFTALAKRELKPTSIYDFGATDHNFLTGDIVRADNTTGQLPGGLLEGVDYYVKKLSDTTLTLHGNLTDAQNGTNPVNVTDAGVGTSRLIKTIACSAVLGNSNNCLATAHNLDLTGGDFIQFTTDGTFPTPLAQNTVYRAEPPSSANSFTINDTSPAAINITALGSGQLFLIISRTFTVTFDDTWGVDTTNLNNADEIKFDSTLTLPGCTPAIDEVTTYFVKVISDNVVEIYTDVGLTAQVTINSFGTGVLFLALERAVNAAINSAEVIISPGGFLKNEAGIRFETNGALPAPLSLGVDYKIVKVPNTDDRVTFKTATDVPISFVNIGSGLHNFINQDEFAVDLSFQLSVPQNEYVTGNKVTASSTDTLPNPILTATDYFIRRISGELIELYDSKANAENTVATVGRIEATSSGIGTHSLTQILPNWKVSKVTNLLKDVSNDTINVYAWDVGRKDNLTLLGEYRSYETNPKYRRIILPCCCEWIRMRFHMSKLEIRSRQDFIPLEHKTALKLMVEALDLQDKKFITEAEVFENKAVSYLEEEEAIQAGPETVQIQFNDDIYTNPDEQYMT